MVGSAGEEPRLRRVERAVEHAEVGGRHVTPEHLDGDDERILQQVAEAKQTSVKRDRRRHDVDGRSLCKTNGPSMCASTIKKFSSFLVHQ